MKQKKHSSIEPGKRDSFKLEALEPRLLFSADAASLFAANQAFADNTFPGGEPASAVVAPYYQVEASSVTAQESEATTPPIELVIIDRSLEDSDWIAEQLSTQDGTTRIIEFLDTDRDGIDQISELLAKYESVSAVHIFSHGQQAELQLGNSTIDAQDLLIRADQISAWSQSLTNDADLLIYGCDLVGSEAGIEFATLLGQLTTADVAASTNLTGSSALGGDWQLEYRSGAIEANTEMGDVLLSDYSSTLATTYTVSNNQDSGTNSLRWAIEQANADNDDSIIVFSEYHYIYLTSELPDIKKPLTIDGTTYPGAPNYPSITIVGTGTSSGNGLTLASGSDGSVIKGLSIRDFKDSGILIDKTDSHTITQTDIGSDGTANFGNGKYGIEIIDGKNNNIGSTTISGTNIERILISDNALSGIHISGSGSTGNAINNVYIGFGWDEQSIANGSGASGEAGIYLTDGASDNTIGTEYSNVISGNEGSGIRISGSNTTGNVISGNVIGLDETITVDIANTGSGIWIDNDASDNTIGGLVAGDGNIITSNEGDGIRITGSNSIGNSILRNIIENNAGQAISLNGGSLTANDVDDVDSGPNDYQNYTVLTSAITDESGSLTITGSLNTTPNKSYRIEFFATDTPNASGHGGASVYLGSTNFSTGASGTVNGAFAFSANVAVGTYITSTTTEFSAGGNYGSTSEFSENIETVRSNSDPVFTSSNSFDVDENSSSVGTITTNDSNGDTPVYSLVSTKDYSFFTIDSSTGQLSFLSPPDYETPLSANGDNDYLVSVEVDDGYGGVVTQEITVTVNNVSEGLATISDTDPTVDSVPENSTPGTLVGITANTSDGDAGQTITYTLSNSSDDKFTIDSNTGVVSVAGDLNKETGNSHSITVLATSSDGSITNESFTIAVEDVNENPVITSSPIVDATADLQYTYNLSATDIDAGDTLTFSATTLPSWLTVINNGSTSGKLTGTPGPGQGGPHNVVLVVTDAGGLTDTQSFTINVSVNQAPVFSSPSGFSIAENQGAVGNVIASDGDTGDTLSYSIAGGTDSSLFQIDAVTGALSFKVAPDFEAPTDNGGNNIYNVTVGVNDGSGTSNATSTQALSVTVTDLNDNAPVIDAAQSFSIDEDAIDTTVVGTVTANDPDTVGSITWSIAGGNTGNAFAIDVNTGEITVANTAAIDYENSQQFTLSITASDGVNADDTENVIININDAADEPLRSIVDIDGLADRVDENSAIGSSVGIEADTSDGDAGQTISYSLSSNPGNLFSIDTVTGKVTTAVALNRETAASHTIEVTATSSDLSTANKSFVIQVGDVDEFDVGVVTDNNADSNIVKEDSKAGAIVGVTAIASDGDSTDTVSYALSNNAGGLFAINSTTGVVTLTGALDRETAASHTIEVTATSSDSSTTTQSFVILVGDVDEFDVGVVTDNDSAINTVDENATAGATVGITATATDADSTNNTVSYSLSNNPGSLFSIDAATGVVTLAGALDRETAASHTIEVTATSTDSSSSTQSFVILVGDIDEFNVGVVTDSNAATNTIDENASAGATVGITASASDEDSTNNTVSYTLSNNAGGLFTINATTGIVTLVGALDREAAASHTIEVTATSTDSSSSTQSFVILVGDIDEFNVGVVTDNDAATNTIDENASAGATVGITASASDADSTNNTVSYSLSNNPGSLFSIDATTGVVTLAGALDRETAASHTIEVTATSTDSSSSTQSFVILVGDIDEFNVGVVTDSNAATNTIDENASAGATVGITASASDEDSTNNTVSYTLSNNAGGLFTINATTGIVTLVGALDREAAASHTIEVTATSTDSSSSTQSFVILVGDIDEFNVGVVTDNDAATNTIDENASAGATVGITASASDADSTNNTVSYSLSNNPGSLFSIDATTGVVTLAGALDRETAASHTIEVTATSTDSSSSTQSFVILVGDIDEFNVGVVTDSNAATNTIDENASAGATVGITASASDTDSTNNTVSYTLSNNAGGLFDINTTTGIVTLIGALDREAAASHTIEVTATSTDSSSSTQSFVILVGDVNEFDVGAISDSDAATNTINESATAGATVGVTAIASDADSTDTISYSLSNNPGSLFTIDTTTGVVTLVGTLDRETAASHTIEVTATSTDSSTSTQSFVILVGDSDEFNVGIVTDNDSATNTVNENSIAGATVGITASATDADSTNNTVSYTLTNNAGGLFDINTTTGIVTLIGALDREAAASHTIEVTATSTDSSSSTQSFVILVRDVDEFNVGVVTDNDAATNTIDENASAGATVGITASASDADSTNNTVSYSLSNNPGSLFSIDATTGVVTLAGALDRETAASHTIEVTATSTDSSSSTQSFVILVGDIDEFNVGVVTDSNAATNTIDENASAGATVGITASASDADSTNNTVSYTLSNNAGGLFDINTTTGIVTLVGALDREAAASHTIEVTATSTDSSSSTQSFVILVGDVNEFDVGAISDSDAATNTINESATAGATVGVTAIASDADSTDTISYSLSNNPGSLFTIDTTTGVVTLVGTLDRETAASHTIEVTSTSTDSSSSTQSFVILVGDSDEFNVGIVTDNDSATNTVNENAIAGATVGITASATDADSTNNTVSYTLSNNAGGLFDINTTTGIVTLIGALDREAAASHTIEVTATSTDSSSSTQSFVILVGDVDEFDAGVVTDSDAATNTINENATAGATVGVTAIASDADSTDTISYSLSNNPGSLFTIDATTGVVTLAGALDRETAASHTIEVTATSTDSSSSTQSFVILVGDSDEFNVGIVTDNDSATNTVNENAIAGATVGITASATDADSTNNTVSYTLSNNAGGLFDINTTTGIVTLIGALDREAAASHTIEVTATSTDSSSSTQSFVILVGDVDEFDAGVVTDSDAATNTINENATAGATVGVTAIASDADSTDTISYSLSNNPGSLFTIDATTGVVTLAGALDRETAASHTIEVTATSTDSSTSTQSFVILVGDSDEFNVGIVTDNDSATNTVNENAIAGATVGITASATDADSTNNTVSYTLSNNAGGLFTINATTGVVTLVGALDRESAASHTIEVTATSSDTSTATESFVILVGDVDEFDVGAISDSDAATNTINESATAGATVGITAEASDADSTDTISYSLSNNPGSLFTIDATTGIVTLAGALDRETAASHTIEVTATSTDSSTSTQSFIILVGDADEFDVGVVTDNDATTNTISESATAGATVGITASASDADSTDTISYSLSNNPGSLFTIDASTGIVTLIGALDREAAASHTIEVTATSTDSSSSTQSFIILVGDVDEFDVGVVTDSDAATNTINESATAGATVGITAEASDADSTDTISYSLSNNPGSLFTIDASTGIVTLIGALDREAAASHTIEVTATSTDSSSSTQSFIILVGDVDEFDVGVVTDSDVSANTVDENATTGATVGVTASASDADSTDTISYSLSNNPGSLFSIDASTGIVTLIGALDREAAASHTIEVTATSTDSSTSTQSFIILVGDADEFDVGVVTDNDATTNTISESATAGATVGITASASDADSTDTISYSLSNNPGSLFTIDASTGIVTLIGALDREAAASHTIEVTATSTDSSSSTQSFVILVGDVDEFDVGVVTDNDAASNTISESATAGATVGITASASDADSTDTISYSLSNNPGGLFSIDATTGVVTLVGALDRESAASHSIEVTATSTDSSFSTQSFVILVGDADEFDVSVVTDSDVAANTVDENATTGATVGVTAVASDADGTDTVSYSLSDNPGSLFAIDATTGIVTLVGTLDRETAASHTIEVTATSSDTSTAIQSFIILIGDANEFDVGVVTDSDVSANTVDENATTGAAVGVTASASDADSTDTISYSLSNNPGSLFTIDATTGVVTLAGALDRETAASHTIEVTATSTDSSFSTQSFIILVGDADEFDVGVVTDSDAAANTVDEKATAGATVGVTAVASDTDGADTVSYSLSNNPGSLFSIDATTGIVTLAGALDRETAASHTIEVTATSSDSSTSTQSFVILVGDSDEFDVGVVTDSDAAANTVDENATAGATVGVTASATDADSTNNTVSYTLSNNPDGLFSIDATTGIVTLAGALDRETAASHTIEVTATSSDSSTSTQSFVILVGDTNEFQISPITDIDTGDNSIDHKAAIGTVVGITASATDTDSTATVTYSLTNNANGLFTIDESTGVITLTESLGRESEFSYMIEVTASSSDKSTSNHSFLISVENVNSAPEIVSSSTFSTPENQADVGQVNATDLDGDSVQYSITGGPDAVHFQINASTGYLSFKLSPDFEAPRDTSNSNRYELTVAATDANGTATTQAILVKVTDVNMAPTLNTTEMSSSAQFTGVIGQIQVFDPDLQDQVTLQITGGSAQPYFTYDAQTAQLTQNQQLNKGQYSLQVMLIDTEGNATEATLMITILGDPRLAAAMPDIASPSLPDVSGSLAEHKADSGRPSPPTPDHQRIDGMASIESEGSIDPENVDIESADTDVLIEDLLTATTDGISIYQSESASNADIQQYSQTQHIANETASAQTRLLNILEGIKSRGLVTTNLVIEGYDFMPFTLTLSPLDSSGMNSLSQDLKDSQSRDQQQETTILAIGGVASVALTAGFVTWMFKAGLLLSAARTSAPLWSAIDPIPILHKRESDDESNDSFS
ncbi:cadherin domain-containing protein [Granulosicoccus antarcticus]|uniref:Cadherin domain-containing protein n=1 Tax=Granulosicoccus antarcticus IMCC3135 TaxID=1192854 RepID=A0A2Z2NNB0_9GAMM|nr:cadherin domain-containing protein [Granulosicoccus antarcticus]ASJ72713.1 hypothetical protein IMCC3135_13125 [Granulosicoccus antarcticus IMCC3135]